MRLHCKQTIENARISRIWNNSSMDKFPHKYYDLVTLFESFQTVIQRRLRMRKRQLNFQYDFFSVLRLTATKTRFQTLDVCHGHSESTRNLNTEENINPVIIIALINLFITSLQSNIKVSNVWWLYIIAETAIYTYEVSRIIEIKN